MRYGLLGVGRGGGNFLNYTMKMAMDKVINMLHVKTRETNKWQGSLPKNYQFY